jgi:phosphatidylserine/phosphatidylglycerophosphate/cardiolipin synthase-like enzyme
MLKKLLLVSICLSARPVLATQITVGFSPSGQAEACVLNVINSATTRIDMAAYSFTSKPIARALIKASERGVKVRVVADEKDNAHSRYSAVYTMMQHHIPVRLDGHYAIMHNKFLVADNSTTETGSFNYTASADKRNAENALVVRDQTQLAGVYETEFERLWQESEAPTGSGLSAPKNRNALMNVLSHFVNS